MVNLFNEIQSTTRGEVQSLQDEPSLYTYVEIFTCSSCCLYKEMVYVFFRCAWNVNERCISYFWSSPRFAILQI